MDSLVDEMADGVDPGLLLVFCHGFVKMILKDIIEDSEIEDTIMLKIINIWVDPMLQDPPELKQVITPFLDICASQSSRTQRLLQRVSDLVW